ncbi:unnamed protein product [Arctogadus glacialis]
MHLLGLIDITEHESSDIDLELSTVRHQPEGLDQLQAQTKFTKKELQSLYRGFKNECPSGLVDEETFKSIYSQFFPQGDATTYAHFLFNAFDKDRNGSIRFEDFVIGLSVLLRGSVTEKLNWAFNLYDINKDGYITKEEMLAIMKSIYDMMGRYTYPCVRDEAPSEHVDKFFQKMDRNRDGVVTIEEFIETCQKDENIMNSMQLFENNPNPPCAHRLQAQPSTKVIRSPAHHKTKGYIDVTSAERGSSYCLLRCYTDRYNGLAVTVSVPPGIGAEERNVLRWNPSVYQLGANTGPSLHAVL